jgi:hypothetical protein
MEFKIYSANYYSKDSFERKYTKALEPFKFKDGVIKIKTLENLIKLQEVTGHKLIFDAKEKSIYIYDSWIE